MKFIQSLCFPRRGYNNELNSIPISWTSFLKCFSMSWVYCHFISKQSEIVALSIPSTSGKSWASLFTILRREMTNNSLCSEANRLYYSSEPLQSKTIELTNSKLSYSFFKCFRISLNSYLQIGTTNVPMIYSTPPRKLLLHCLLIVTCFPIASIFIIMLIEYCLMDVR